MVASDQHSNKIQCGVTQNADTIWCILWVKSLACVLTYCPLGNMVVILYVLFSIKLSYLYFKTCLDNNLQANRRKIIAWIDNCQVDQVFHVVIKIKKNVNSMEPVTHKTNHFNGFSFILAMTSHLVSVGNWLKYVCLPMESLKQNADTYNYDANICIVI